MYTIYDEKGNRILDIEHGLSEIESRFVAIREKRLEKNLPLSTEERLIILTFIAAIHNRTPSVRDHISSQWKKVIDIGNEMQEAYLKATPEQRKMMSSLGPINDDNETYSMEDAENFYTKPLQTLMIPRIIGEAKLYSMMNMAILNTNDEVGFITSDQPCVWFDPEAYKRPPLYQSVGLGYESVEVTFPVSPKQAIIISHFNLPLYNQVKIETVDSINRKTRFMANKNFIVNKCYKKEFWFKVLKPTDL